MQERIKDHEREILCGLTSVVSEHVNKAGNHPLWNEVNWFIGQDSSRLLPNNFSKDNGIEILDAWIPTIKKHNRRLEQLRTTEETIFSCNLLAINQFERL